MCANTTILLMSVNHYQIDQLKLSSSASRISVDLSFLKKINCQERMLIQAFLRLIEILVSRVTLRAVNVL